MIAGSSQYHARPAAEITSVCSNSIIGIISPFSSLQEIRHNGVEKFGSRGSLGVRHCRVALVAKGLCLTTDHNLGYIMGNPVMDYGTLKIKGRGGWHYTLFQIRFSLIQQFSDGLCRFFVTARHPIHGEGD
jgi:hypothetical protein